MYRHIKLLFKEHRSTQNKISTKWNKRRLKVTHFRINNQRRNIIFALDTCLDLTFHAIFSIRN